MTFGSLFAGIGGLDLGLERAGMVCKWQVEIDDYARRVLQKNFPNVARWSDVKTFPPSGEWSVDLVCGGFPCQDISCAGRGDGIDGSRSSLFHESIRVACQLKPRYVLLENVAALLFRGMDRVCGELARIGYDCEWHCIPAAAVGAPHIRDRVFILAYSECGRLAKRWRTAPTSQKGNRSTRVCEPVPSRRVFQARTPLAGYTENQAQWENQPNVHRVANGVPNRVDRLRGLGNAVVPQVAEWIGRRIMEHEGQQ